MRCVWFLDSHLGREFFFNATMCWCIHHQEIFEPFQSPFIISQVCFSLLKYLQKSFELTSFSFFTYLSFQVLGWDVLKHSALPSFWSHWHQWEFYHWVGADLSHHWALLKILPSVCCFSFRLLYFECLLGYLFFKVEKSIMSIISYIVL